MKNPTPKDGTLARSHADGLTLDQLNAVDLLAAGKNDTETAAALNVNRVSVTRWRCYGPEFRAALAVRRADIWGASADRLRSLIPKALDALADALADTRADRVTVALAVLKLAGPLPLLPTEPTNPDEYVRQEVERERALTPSVHDRILARANGHRDYHEHAADVLERLNRRASEAPSATEPPRGA